MTTTNYATTAGKEARAIPLWLVWAFQLVLFGYVGGSLALNRDFARLGIGIGPLTLFVGEVSIAILLLLCLFYLWRQQRLPIVWDPVTLSLVLYILAGAAFLVAGFLRGYFVSALRDSAIVYYALFFFFTLLYASMVSREIAFRRLWRTVIVSSTLGAVLLIIEYVVQFFRGELALEYGHFGHSATALGVCIVMAWLVVNAASQPSRKSYTFLVLYVPLFVLTLIIVAYRSILLSIAAGAIIALLAALGRGRPVALRTAGMLIVLLIVVIIGSLTWGDVGGYIETQLSRWQQAAATADATESESGQQSKVSGGRALMETQSTRWQQGLSAPLAQGGFSFRITAWQVATNDIISNPITGIGFGPQLETYPAHHCNLPPGESSNCGNPHNTFLTLAIRLGVPVSLLFGGATLLTLTKGIRRLWRRSINEEGGQDLLAMMLVIIIMLAYGGVSLFLESPFLAAPYWALFGMFYLYVFPQPLSRTIRPNELRT